MADKSRRHLSAGLFRPTSMIFAGLAFAVALSGCTRSSDFNQGGYLPSRNAAPLTAVPREDVEVGQLTPPGPATNTQQPVTNSGLDPVAPLDGTPKPVEVASAPSTDSGKPITRQAMVGAWTVSTAGSNCQIFLALTKWSGGYRAASRGCSAKSISDVQAWDVRGTQVVLIDSSGATAANLYRSGAERYDGSTGGGGAISFSR